MSSSREKLRAMSKKNLSDQKQVENQPTLVSDMIDQLNKSKEEQTAGQNSALEKPVKVELEASNEPDSMKEKATSNELDSKNDLPKSTEVKEKNAAPKGNNGPVLNEEKYGGKEVTITLLLSEEVEEYLTFKALELRIPVRQFFKELMINEIENGTLMEDELTKTYRRVQHNTVKKSIPVNENLRAVIKDTAIKYHMKYTTFMAYVIDKARIRDMEKSE